MIELFGEIFKQKLSHLTRKVRGEKIDEGTTVSQLAAEPSHPDGEMPLLHFDPRYNFYEKKSKDKIEKVLAQYREDELSQEAGRILKTVLSIEKNIGAKRSAILKDLSANIPEIAAFLKRREELVRAIDVFVGSEKTEQDVSELRQALEVGRTAVSDAQAKHIDVCMIDKGSTLSPGLEQMQRLKHLKELRILLLDQDLIWRDAFYFAQIPPNLTDSIEQIAETMQLRNALRLVVESSNISDLEKKWLSARLMKDASAAILTPTIAADILEGKTTLDDPLFSENLTNQFIEAIDEIDEVSTETRNKKMSRRGYLIALALLSVMTIGVVTYQRYRSEDENKSIAAEIADDANNSVEDEEVPPQPRTDTKISPENSGEFSTGTPWTIVGEVPNGNFVVSHASYFDGNDWHVDESFLFPYELPKLDNEKVSTFLFSEFLVQSSAHPIPIPIPRGYQIASVATESGATLPYVVVRSSQNTYKLLLKEDIDRPETIVIGLSEVDTQLEGATNVTGDELFYTFDELIDGSTIDENDHALLMTLKNDTTMSVQQKAERVIDHLQHTFVYSLDPQFTPDFTYSRGQFVRRASKLRHGDCDVVNTVAVAYLRYIGIGARMTFGYMNSTAMFNVGSHSLENAESHGWVQYLDPDKGEWVDADATPRVVDEYTAQRLQELNGSVGIDAITEISAIDELFKAMLINMNDNEVEGDTNLFIKYVIAVQICALLNFLTYVGTKKIKKKLSLYLKEKYSKEFTNAAQIDSYTIVSNEAIDTYFSSGAFRSFWPEYIRILTLIPTAVSYSNLLLMQRRIKRSMELERDNPLPHAYDTVDLTFLLSDLLGISVREMKGHLEVAHQQYMLQLLEKQIKQKIHAMITPLFIEVKDLTFSGFSGYNEDFSSIITPEMTLETFLKKLLDTMYKRYITSHKKYTKRVRREQKRGIIGKTTMRSPQESDQETIKYTQKPYSREEFYTKFERIFPDLIQYHRVAMVKSQYSSPKN